MRRCLLSARGLFCVPDEGPEENGFSLLELLLVISLIALLAALIMPAVEAAKARADAVRCLGQLRNFHVSFSSYLLDNGNSWPQAPENISSSAEADFWLGTLRNYGGGNLDAWQCPTLMAQGADPEAAATLHYLPTLFDEKPGTAHKWPKMPWVIEVGDFHGKGNLAVYPDGSVRPFLANF